GGPLHGWPHPRPEHLPHRDARRDAHRTARRGSGQRRDPRRVDVGRAPRLPHLYLLYLDARHRVAARGAGPDRSPVRGCARLPRTKSWADLGFPNIPEPDLGMVDAGEWFDGLTEEEQRAMLGPRGFDAWQAGAFPMDQGSARRSADGWRDSFAPAKPPKEA